MDRKLIEFLGTCQLAGITAEAVVLIIVVVVVVLILLDRQTQLWVALRLKHLVK